MAILFVWVELIMSLCPFYFLLLFFLPSICHTSRLVILFKNVLLFYFKIKALALIEKSFSFVGGGAKRQVQRRSKGDRAQRVGILLKKRVEVSFIFYIYTFFDYCEICYDEGNRDIPSLF